MGLVHGNKAQGLGLRVQGIESHLPGLEHSKASSDVLQPGWGDAGKLGIGCNMVYDPARSSTPTGQKVKYQATGLRLITLERAAQPERFYE